MSAKRESMLDDLMPELHASWVEWAAGLPQEAATEWTRGLGYVRESSAKSVAQRAPISQLRNTLTQAALNRVYIAWEDIAFESESGTDTLSRPEFLGLVERVIADDSVGALAGDASDRLWRNVSQGRDFRDRLRMAGKKLHYNGSPSGDSNDTSTWLIELMQDMKGELDARQTGAHVGRVLEAKSREGIPIGLLPEGYEVAERAPMFQGRQGPALSWRRAEPLATIIAEGRVRYMAGASFSEVARWSLETELAGVTPKGSQMSAWWWRGTLTNPKYAGFHTPTHYTGFRPGVKSPKRGRRTRDNELIPCKVPAIWTLEEHREIWAEMERRYNGARRRDTYRAYLLTGIAYEPSCGHRMSVHHWNKARTGFFMTCRKLDAGGRHAPLIRAEVAERELDDLIGEVDLSDADLVRQIEEELQLLASTEIEARRNFRPNAAIAELRGAIKVLEAAGAGDSARSARDRLAELEAQDEGSRKAVSGPVVRFRKAAKALADWTTIWAQADTSRKNELLRAAGVRVVLGASPEDPSGAGHILSVSAENPAFGLALAAVVAKRSDRGHMSGNSPLHAQMSTPEIQLNSPFREVAERLFGVETADPPITFESGRQSRVQRPTVLPKAA